MLYVCMACVKTSRAQNQSQKGQNKKTLVWCDNFNPLGPEGGCQVHQVVAGGSVCFH